jgi:hypothetical protein
VVEEPREGNVWFHTKFDHGASVRGAVEAFCRILAGCEVRETLYMIRGCYRSDFERERGPEGRDSAVFAVFVASNEGVRLFFEASKGRDSREILLD